MANDADRENAENLAPRWHTALLVFLIVAVALTGTLLASGTSATPVAATGANRLTDRLVGLYLPVFVVDWGLVFYVSRLGRRENALWHLLGVIPRTARRIAGDAALACGLFVLIEGGEWLAAALAGGGASSAAGAATAASAPLSHAERLVWVVFAFTAGFCEEVVYRGYLRRQLAAFVATRASAAASAAWGIGLSALLFGVAHLDQGVAPALRFAVYAVGFGVLAQRRRSLIPGIACHVAVDLLSGLAR